MCADINKPPLKRLDRTAYDLRRTTNKGISSINELNSSIGVDCGGDNPPEHFNKKKGGKIN